MKEIPSQSFRMPSSDAQTYLTQAVGLMNAGRFQEAIPLYESALAALERTYGSDQPELAECMQALGDAYEAAYRLGDALAIHTRLLHLGERVLGKSNPNVVAMLFKLAQINEMLGRPEDALGFCQQALEAARQCLAQDDPLSMLIIDRYLYLQTLLAGQGQAPAPLEPTPQWREENLEPLPGADLAPLEVAAGASSMQDFARQMLKDMPGHTSPAGLPNDNFVSAAQEPPQQVIYQPPEPISQSTAVTPSVAAKLARVNIHIIPSPSPVPIPVINSSLSLNPTPISNETTVPPGTNGNSVPIDMSNHGNFSTASHAAPEAVPSTRSAGTPFPHHHSDNPSNDSYSAILAAGFTAAQNLTQNGEEQYSLNDLKNIRPGRKDFGEESIPPAASKARRIGASSNQGLLRGRNPKDLIMTAVCVVVVIGTILFLFSGHGGESTDTAAAVSSTAAVKNAASNQAQLLAMFRTADGGKEVRLIAAEKALMVTANSGIEVPYSSITSDPEDLCKAIACSVVEKQIWAEKKDYGLKTQDEIVYYLGDGPEAKVMAKMRRLAGWAQAYYLKNGQYPKFVSPEMVNEFSFVNPMDGRGIPIQIRTLLSQNSDGMDARGGLEAGLEAGLVTNGENLPPINAPCSITCYAVVPGKSDADAAQGRPAFFLIRGCDRDGNFLSSGQAGRSYVVAADNNNLSALPSGTAISSAVKTSAKNRLSSRTKLKAKIKGDLSGPNPETAKSTSSTPPAVPVEKPFKNTRLWLITEPALPMLLIHHALPLILAGLALLALLQARLVRVEPTGNSISSTSNAGAQYAMLAAAIFGGLAVLIIIVQFLVFY